MELVHQARPRRRRPPTRGLLFGASLERVPPAEPGPKPGPGGLGPAHRPDPVPTALIGASSPVAPPPVTPFGSMAAGWPLADRPRGIRHGEGAPTGWASFASSVVLPDRRQRAGGPAGGIERRRGGLSESEWERLLGR